MSAQSPSPPPQPNTLGNASLVLGILAVSLVFGIGICALTGASQGWVQIAGTPLLVCGVSSSFLGLLGAILGLAGLFGANRSRATAIVGLLLGLTGICLFVAFLGALGQ
ncbi:hypothetical protein ACFLZW_02960 [Chloroflexota bacterium]